MTAHRDLRRVVGSLATRLPDQMEGMLDDGRLEAGRQALDRLRGASHASGLDALDPAEAGWLAEELLRRWAALGDVVLDPVAWIEPAAPLGDAEGDPGATVRLVVHTDGLEPGWTVAWNGAVAHEDDATVAVPTSAEPATARVMGRGPQGRAILTARWEPTDSWSPAPGEVPPARPDTSSGAR